VAEIARCAKTRLSPQPVNGYPCPKRYPGPFARRASDFEK
jgi:hypothetical protein